MVLSVMTRALRSRKKGLNSISCAFFCMFVLHDGIRGWPYFISTIFEIYICFRGEECKKNKKGNEMKGKRKGIFSFIS